ncbi:MAG: hypothetical protein ACTSSP_07175, partial [Candidatus Asgardarchaeia archaeon]
MTTETNLVLFSISTPPVLDSINELNLSPDDIRILIEKNPKLSTIQIFKATKEEKFLGQNDFQ